MPRIIHRALLERLLRLPEVSTFLQDFETLSGLALQLLDEFGAPVSPAGHRSPLCLALEQDPAGRRLCGQARRRLLERRSGEAAACSCDAGLEEQAVPLQMGGHTVGFLLFAGFRHGPLQNAGLARTRHLLDRAGCRLEAARHRKLLQASPVLSAEAAAALARLVASMASHLSRLAAPRFLAENRPLPPLAHRARRHLRTHGLTGPCTLAETARACGVSPAHLSRVFHQSTGLTISEYLARFRVEHAIELLREHRRTVAEVAWASGFRSLSQFNRTFKRLAGCTPTQIT